MPNDEDPITIEVAGDLSLPPGVWNRDQGRLCLRIPLVYGPPWAIRCYTVGDARRLASMLEQATPVTEADRGQGD